MENASLNSLRDRIPPQDKRFVTFQYTLHLMSARKVRTIVETGTARDGECNCAGDGCSTPIWGQWAKQNGAYVYSVDIDPEAVRCSSAACTPYLDHMTFVASDSVTFLENFNKPIDFLYLDSYDFDLDDPLPSQEHHLKEIIAAYPWLHAKSIIMIDDCALPFGGKGRLVIEYLLDRGWKIALSYYQIILTYE
ncbi:MAG: class I SAM-dependent methyltransferase [Rhabdochlamydiaceae bacterium]